MTGLTASIDAGTTLPPRSPLNCDGVSHVLRSLECLLGAAVSPTATYARTAGAKVACLVEIMDIFGVGFEDQNALENAFSPLQLKQRMAEHSRA